MSAPMPNQMSARTAAACPWCGSGTALAARGDGLGNMVLMCTTCGCKGPPMPITGEFDDADHAAIARWSIRPPPPARLGDDAIDRIRRAFAVQSLLYGADQADASVPVRMGDLAQLLQVANVRLG